MADLAGFLLSDFDPANHLLVEGLHAALEKFVKEIRNISVQKLGQQVDGSNFLQLLDPARNSLAYLFVLHARLETVKKQQVPDDVLFAVTGFLTSFEPMQIRYAGPEWRQLISWLDEVIRQNGNFQLVTPIRIAILRMDPTAATFTKPHLLFVQLCLESGAPRQALPILDKDIYSLPSDPIWGVDDHYPCNGTDLSCAYITKSSGIAGNIMAEDLQEYYLLGSQVYLGLRLYERAQLFLELAISIPTQHHAVNPYMVEAYKKLRLVGLLYKGKAYSATHLVDQASLKTIQNLSRPYDALVSAFEKRDLQRFYAEMDVASEHWTDDGNVGIVQQVAEALRRYRVIDLQRTYAALPVDRVAIHLSLSTSATMDLLTAMIRENHLNANLLQGKPSTSTDVTAPSSATPILKFRPQTSNHSDAQVDALVQEQLQRIQELSAYVKEADRNMAVTREWADYVRKSKQSDAGAAAFEDPIELYADTQMGNLDDEDIMAS